MKSGIILLLIFNSFLLQAQDNSETSTDSDLIKKSNTLDMFVAPMFSSNQFANTWATFVGIGIGLKYSNKLELNISYFKGIDNFNRQIIFPSSHKYEQSNIGIQAQYLFFNSKIRPLAGIGVQYGEVSWVPNNDASDTFTDHIFIYNIFVGVDWQISKIFSFQVNAGYIVTGDIELVGFESNDYYGLKGDIILKIRLLNLMQ